MMALENDHDEQKPVSMLEENGYGTSRILARESSVGQSSRIFYRAAEGVPFKWEMMPGTPKNPQEEDAIPPLSPPPSIQNLGLPLPNLDHDESDQGSGLKLSKIWSFKQKIKKSLNHDIIKKIDVLGKKRIKQQENSTSNYVDSDVEFRASSVKGSSFSSHSSFPRDSIDAPFCCSPWNVSSILEEGNRKIYYCRQHKTAYTIEEGGSYLSPILSRFSGGADDQFSGPLQNGGIPFRWEMQPGTPKNPPENDVIPPPSPPPVVQSSVLPRPTLHPSSKDSKWKRAWLWMKGNRKEKKTDREISFRYHGIHNGMEILSSENDEEDVCSLSSVSPMSKNRDMRMSRIKKSFKDQRLGCGGPWNRREILVFARRKFKSFGF